MSIRWVLWALVVAAGSLAWADAFAEAPAAGGLHLFVDDAEIAFKVGVERHVHPCEKLPKPVLEPETPWEKEGDDARVYLYGTVLRDPQSGRFRMWYNRLRSVLYATSEDGIRWERPELGLVELNGDTNNNGVLLEFHSPSVVFNPDAAPAERYAMLGYRKTPDRGYTVAHSPDGLRWQLYPKNPVLPHGDTCTLMFDARTGEYLAFHKRSEPWRGHERRLVYMASSPNLQEWTEPKLVMAPDETDDAQVQREGGQQSHFYNMSGFPYGDHFLGFLTHFRHTGPPAQEGPQQSGQDGLIDAQLVHSRDGRAWERCEDRSPVIPNGPQAYDAGCILGVANGVIPVGDEIWTYYTAITTTHGGAIPEKRVTIALAKWRLDGFVSLDAGADEGIVRTVPLDRHGDRLTVNAIAGHLTAAVLDESGHPIPGYSHEDCNPITGDSVRHAVAWRGRPALPENGPFCLEFHMRNTELFSFSLPTRQEPVR